ncbi:MAG: endo-1,4-beta-xylanase, partial [Deltaproteobacteria bacterium]|nr:endo-1,4-beta-xylanase [Deltaproteobacteria bacterium]
MKNLVRCFVLGLLFVAVSCQTAEAAGLRAMDAIFQSAGNDRDDYWWRLGQNGYVGTFINLNNPATVNINIDAKAEQTDGVWPEMDLHIGDRKLNWTVNTEYPTDYTGQVSLGAGTHLVRTEYINDTECGEGGITGNHTLYLGTLSLTGGGVEIQNVADRAHVNAATDTYIENYRKGDAKVGIRINGSPAPEGMAIRVKLTSHAFNFGTAVSGVYSTDPKNYLRPNPEPESDAYIYQQKLRENFNMIVPSSGGKWANNEPDWLGGQGHVAMEWVDQFLDFAEDNDIRARMHTTTWFHRQTPMWVMSMVDLALTGNENAKARLRAAIS